MRNNKAIVKQALDLVLKGYSIDKALEIARCFPKQYQNCRYDLRKALEAKGYKEEAK